MSLEGKSFQRRAQALLPVLDKRIFLVEGLLLLENPILQEKLAILEL